MTGSQNPNDWRAGQTIYAGGYFTLSKYIHGVSGVELARRLGYEPGRLSGGWALVFFSKLPTVHQFSLRGYSHFSGGKVQGHLSANAGAPHVEDLLREDGIDVEAIKKRQLRELFTLTGPNRLAKAVPLRMGQQYPPGSGVPQWELKTGTRLVAQVAGILGSNQAWTGGHAV
ncbi:MAG: hypothetical protein AAGA70_06090 [Pseudomonadota bacterium]